MLVRHQRQDGGIEKSIEDISFGLYKSSPLQRIKPSSTNNQSNGLKEVCVPTLEERCSKADIEKAALKKIEAENKVSDNELSDDIDSEPEPKENVNYIKLL